MAKNKMIETMEVFGKRGRLVINVCDLADWKAKGYKTEKPEAEKEDAEEGKGKKK